MALMYLPLYLFLLGICSVFLWLPALGVGSGLLVLRPSFRRQLGRRTSKPIPTPSAGSHSKTEQIPKRNK